jgi:hypothetical protein
MARMARMARMATYRDRLCLSCALARVLQAEAFCAAKKWMLSMQK